MLLPFRRLIMLSRITEFSCQYANEFSQTQLDQMRVSLSLSPAILPKAMPADSFEISHISSATFLALFSILTCSDCLYRSFAETRFATAYYIFSIYYQFTPHLACFDFIFSAFGTFIEIIWTLRLLLLYFIKYLRHFITLQFHIYHMKISQMLLPAHGAICMMMTGKLLLEIFSQSKYLLSPQPLISSEKIYIYATAPMPLPGRRLLQAMPL